MTLSELIDLYRIHHPALSPRTLANYFYAVQSLERHHGRLIQVAELSEAIILPWLAKRLRERSAKSVRRERSDLLTLWRFARKRGLVALAPEDIPVVKLPRRNPNSWTVAEYQRIIAACRDLPGDIRGTGIPKALWWESLLTFLYWVGCRIGAALAVRTADLDLERGFVKLRAEVSKTNWEQVITLNRQAIAALQQIYSAERIYVWPYPYHRDYLWQYYKTILAGAGLPKDRLSMFQRIRRTTYTLCVKFGSKDIASHQLGHRTDMSGFYLDVSQIEIKQAAQILPTL